VVRTGPKCTAGPSITHLRTSIKIAFASGSEELIPAFLDRIERIYPELELYVMSEYPPQRGKWIPYHVGRTFRENLECCKASLRDKEIRLAAVLLQPQMPLTKRTFAWRFTSADSARSHLWQQRATMYPRIGPSHSWHPAKKNPGEMAGVLFT